MFRTYYAPIIKYGAKTQRIISKEWSRIKELEIRFSSPIKSKTRRDKIRNTERTG